MELDLIREDLVINASSLLERLTLSWQDFKHTTGSPYEHSQFSEIFDFQGQPHDWILTTLITALPFEIMTANVISTYDSAVIITSSILKDVDTAQSTIHARRIAVHSQSILEAVRWHHTAGSESGGDISVVFALRTVYRCTPVQCQKVQAEEELARWGAVRGVVGISKLSDQDLSSNPPYNLDSTVASTASRIMEVS